MYQSQHGRRSGRSGYQSDPRQEDPYQQPVPGQAEGALPHDQSGRYQQPGAPAYQRPDPSRQPDASVQQGPSPYDGYYRQPPPPGYAPGAYAPAGSAAPAGQPQKKRRIFMWFFFAVQTLFLIWLVAGIATGNHSNATDLAQACDGRNWFPIFKSHADCMTHYNNALNDAQDLGKGIGAALIVIIWVVVDFFLGLGYGVYRLATRSR